MACIFPYYVDNPLFPLRSRERSVPVPCGRCPDCLSRRSNSWSFRLLQEAKVCDSAHFVTLTYDSEHVPVSSNGLMTLVKADFQKFMKRLRKANYGSKLRYYACGEYGSSTFRPHYHAIIFNADVETFVQSWRLDNVDIGQIHVGDVTGASINYTLKYMCKGRIIPVHDRDDRLPEFSLMSKRMGVNYLSDEVVRYHRADPSRLYVVSDGHKIAMPRYFREKIWNEKERRDQSLHIAKVATEKDEKSRRDFYERTGDLKDYDRSLHMAKAQAIQQFKDRAKTNRKKI